MVYVQRVEGLLPTQVAIERRSGSYIGSSSANYICTTYHEERISYNGIHQYLSRSLLVRFTVTYGFSTLGEATYAHRGLRTPVQNILNHSQGEMLQQKLPRGHHQRISATDVASQVLHLLRDGVSSKMIDRSRA